VALHHVLIDIVRYPFLPDRLEHPIAKMINSSQMPSPIIPDACVERAPPECTPILFILVLEGHLKDTCGYTMPKTTRPPSFSFLLRECILTDGALLIVVVGY
jgi:hypothetical protein